MPRMRVTRDSDRVKLGPAVALAMSLQRGAMVGPFFYGAMMPLHSGKFPQRVRNRIPPIFWRWEGRDYSIHQPGHYADGSAALLVSDNETGEPYAMLTVCILDGSHTLGPGEILVKTWSENEKLCAALLADGVFTDTGRRVPTNYCEASIWRVNR